MSDFLDVIRGRGSSLLLDAPPKIADTDECAQRACLRIADVTVIHSVTTSATGSTATDMVSGPVDQGLLSAVPSMTSLEAGRLGRGLRPRA